MAELPDPLTPADCDLRSFEFMQVDIRRLLTSETWLLANGDESKAAMTLWLESWHQVPAGSLPDNDRMLAVLSQAGGTWRKVKTAALRGWIKCSDGRLYHPVVCEKAAEAWEKKQAQQNRTAAATRARMAKKATATNDTPPTTTPPSEANVAAPTIDRDDARNVSRDDNVTTTVTMHVTSSRGEERRREEIVGEVGGSRNLPNVSQPEKSGFNSELRERSFGSQAPPAAVSVATGPPFGDAEITALCLAMPDIDVRSDLPVLIRWAERRGIGSRGEVRQAVSGALARRQAQASIAGMAATSAARAVVISPELAALVSRPRRLSRRSTPDVHPRAIG